MANPNLFVRWFDYFGREFTLNVQGQTKYKTVFGSIVGLISIICILAVSVYFMVDLFQRNNMTVIANYDETILPVNNLTNTPIIITLADSAAKRVPSEGIYSLKAHYIEYLNARDENNNSYIKVNFKQIPLNNCTSRDFSDYSTLFAKVNPNDWLCIPANKYNLTLFGKFGDVINGFSMLQVFFSKCKNTTNNSNCLDEAKINSKILGSQVAISYVSNEINPYNYDSPNELNLQSSSLFMSPYITKRYQYYLQQNNYETDYGFFFQNKIKKTFYTFDQYTMDVDMGELMSLSGQPYIGLISIRNSCRIAQQFRAYTKLQSFIANVGGVIKSIMLVSGFLVRFITNNLVLQNISNIIFKFDDRESNQANQINFNNVGRRDIYKGKTTKVSNIIEHTTKNNILTNKVQTPSFNDKPNIIYLDKNADLLYVNPIQVNKDNPNMRRSLTNPRVMNAQIEPVDLNVSFSNCQVKSAGPVVSKRRVELIFWEKVCRQSCMKKNKNLNMLRNCEEYINHKLSLEYIITEFHKIDTVISQTVNKEYLKEMNCANVPYHNTLKEKVESKKDSMPLANSSNSLVQAENKNKLEL